MRWEVIQRVAAEFLAALLLTWLCARAEWFELGRGIRRSSRDGTYSVGLGKE